jgi:hypothetical protein
MVSLTGAGHPPQPPVRNREAAVPERIANLHQFGALVGQLGCHGVTQAVSVGALSMFAFSAARWIIWPRYCGLMAVPFRVQNKTMPVSASRSPHPQAAARQELARYSWRQALLAPAACSLLSYAGVGGASGGGERPGG